MSNHTWRNLVVVGATIVVPPQVSAQGTWNVTLRPTASGGLSSQRCGDGTSMDPSISADGRFVAFESDAQNLTAADINGYTHVYVCDRQTATTTRVSVDSAGVLSIGNCYSPSISADGRFVAFHSTASNLVANDTNGRGDVFVRDRQTATTTRVSVSSSGVQGIDYSYQPSISADGRFVAFRSVAWNLVAGDTNARDDVFVHDRQTAITTRVSIDSAGVQGNQGSYAPSISADGRFVTFHSDAQNLVTGDTNGSEDVFVHDRQTATTTRVSVDSAGVQGNFWSYDASISADGRFVAFVSRSTNLVAGDTNGWADVFVHDRQTATTTRVSVNQAGVQGNNFSSEPSISADGRFVAFVSRSRNLVAYDTNGYDDVFVHGPYLTLSAESESVAAGAQATLTTWLGHPGSHVNLMIVEVNGFPYVRPYSAGSFDDGGLWSQTWLVPPGLSGLEVTFRAGGITPIATYELTNPETITFQ